MRDNSAQQREVKQKDICSVTRKRPQQRQRGENPRRIESRLIKAQCELGERVWETQVRARGSHHLELSKLN